VFEWDPAVTSLDAAAGVQWQHLTDLVTCEGSPVAYAAAVDSEFINTWQIDLSVRL
jgi:hypothetical protein